MMILGFLLIHPARHAKHVESYILPFSLKLRFEFTCSSSYNIAIFWELNWCDACLDFLLPPSLSSFKIGSGLYQTKLR